LLLIPLVALTTLWAFAASLTLGDAMNLRNSDTVRNDIGNPSQTLAAAIQNERELTMIYLGDRTQSAATAMESARQATDHQRQEFQTLATSSAARTALPAKANTAVTALLRNMDALRGQRQLIDRGGMSSTQAMTVYGNLVDDTFSVLEDFAVNAPSKVALDDNYEVELTFAQEALSEEEALLSGVLAAGHMTAAQHVTFTGLVVMQHALYPKITVVLRPADQAEYRRIVASPQYQQLAQMENVALATPPSATVREHGRYVTVTNLAPEIGLDAWRDTAGAVLNQMDQLESSVATGDQQQAKPVADSILTRLALAGGLGLVAVVVTLVLTLWTGRSIIRELNRLRRSAQELADERLPSVIRRLRRGEHVDAAAEAPPLAFRTPEIEQVGQAFNAARLTAIQGAVEEAAIRRSVGEVFLNLARRSQTLLHRQLSLLDAMERRISDPEELADLFRLDHLATRMRRHAEGLIILSGHPPGRGWRNPVPIIDVARAAAAEVEDYTRVIVTPMPRIAIAGPAVADVIHLLAELIENATLFSPPETSIAMSGQLAAHGFAMEIEDRGLSMDPAAMAAANQRLADPPEIDLSSSSQLGLFVVGRLAQRHGVRVTLRTSPYGGTTAIVLIPEEITARIDAIGAEPARLALTRRAEEALVTTGTVTDAPEPITQPIAAQPIPSLNGTVVTPHETPVAQDPLPRRRPATAAPTVLDQRADYQIPPAGAGFRVSGDLRDVGDRPSLPRRRSHPSSENAIPSAHDRGDSPLAGRTPSFGQDRPLSLGQDRPLSLGQDRPLSLGQDRPLSLGQDRPLSLGQDRPVGRDGTADGNGRGPFEPAGGRPPAPDEPAVPGPEADGLTPPRGAPVADEPAEPIEPTTTRPPLPRRARQTHLAPELRSDPEMIESGDNGQRSPEELRTMLTSIQRGWLRGRSEADEEDA
jgi:signal transduction histidine kinase